MPAEVAPAELPVLPCWLPVRLQGFTLQSSDPKMCIAGSTGDDGGFSQDNWGLDSSMIVATVVNDVQIERHVLFDKANDVRALEEVCEGAGRSAMP